MMASKKSVDQLEKEIVSLSTQERQLENELNAVKSAIHKLIQEKTRLCREKSIEKLSPEMLLYLASLREDKGRWMRSEAEQAKSEKLQELHLAWGDFNRTWRTREGTKLLAQRKRAKKAGKTPR